MRVRMLDKSVKALMVDDAHTVEQLMVPICQSIGITNHFEYSLVWEARPKVMFGIKYLTILPFVVNILYCIKRTIYKFSNFVFGLRQEAFEKDGTLSKFKLKDYKADEKVKDAKLQELAAKLNLDDTGEIYYIQVRLKTINQINV